MVEPVSWWAVKKQVHAVLFIMHIFTTELFINPELDLGVLFE
jgi:hypothetical protein